MQRPKITSKFVKEPLIKMTKNILKIRKGTVNQNLRACSLFFIANELVRRRSHFFSLRDPVITLNQRVSSVVRTGGQVGGRMGGGLVIKTILRFSYFPSILTSKICLFQIQSHKCKAVLDVSKLQKNTAHNPGGDQRKIMMVTEAIFCGGGGGSFH